MFAVAACSSGGDETGGASTASTSSSTSGAGASDGGSGDVAVLHPNDAPLPGEKTCEVVETTGIPIASRNHVEPCTPVTYATNPPSGGDHWPIWAAYQEYAQPVPHEMYVHDEEHGGVVFLYKCDGACPEVTKALEDAATKVNDVFCAVEGGGEGSVMTRVVITPDPSLDTPIAVAAWGATYTATCIDAKSLASFANAVVGRGPELLCAEGVDESAFPACD